MGGRFEQIVGDRESDGENYDGGERDEYEKAKQLVKALQLHVLKREELWHSGRRLRTVLQMNAIEQTPVTKIQRQFSFIYTFFNHLLLFSTLSLHLIKNVNKCEEVYCRYGAGTDGYTPHFTLLQFMIYVYHVRRCIVQ